MGWVETGSKHLYSWTPVETFVFKLVMCDSHRESKTLSRFGVGAEQSKGERVHFISLDGSWLGVVLG